MLEWGIGKSVFARVFLLSFECFSFSQQNYVLLNGFKMHGWSRKEVSVELRFHNLFFMSI